MDRKKRRRLIKLFTDPDIKDLVQPFITYGEGGFTIDIDSLKKSLTEKIEEDKRELAERERIEQEVFSRDSSKIIEGQSRRLLAALLSSEEK